jgi:D-sedoheptulose 7-phosphate isomerase
VIGQNVTGGNNKSGKTPIQTAEAACAVEQSLNQNSGMDFAEAYRKRTLESIETIDVAKVSQAIEWFRESRDQGRHIFVCGNGGSSATAAHFVCDMVKGASYNHPSRFRIMALGDQLPTLTAYANDLSYDAVFVEQLKNFAEPGDLFLAISGSGNSPNVLRAMEFANQAGCRTVSLTGRDGGQLGSMGHLNIHVPVPHMGRIEDAHMVVCHMICYYFMEADHKA